MAEPLHISSETGGLPKLRRSTKVAKIMVVH